MNKVLFTIRPYSLNYLLLPIFSILFAARLIQINSKFGRSGSEALPARSIEKKICSLIVYFFIPMQFFLNSKFDWSLWLHHSFSLGSYALICGSFFLLKNEEKAWLPAWVLIFSTISLGYFFIEYLFDWYFVEGHKTYPAWWRFYYIEGGNTLNREILVQVVVDIYQNSNSFLEVIQNYLKLILELPRELLNKGFELGEKKFYSRIPGSLDDPNHSSIIYFIGFFLSLCFSKRNKVFLLLSFLFLVAIGITFSRTLVIALSLSVLTAGVFFIGKELLGSDALKVFLFRNPLFSIIPLVLLCCGIYLMLILTPDFSNYPSMELRKDLFLEGIGKFKQHVLFGFGGAEDQVLLSELSEKYAKYPLDAFHIHSTPFYILFNYGLIGFCFAMYFYVNALKLILKGVTWTRISPFQLTTNLCFLLTIQLFALNFQMLNQIGVYISVFLSFQFLREKENNP